MSKIDKQLPLIREAELADVDMRAVRYRPRSIDEIERIAVDVLGYKVADFFQLDTMTLCSTVLHCFYALSLRNAMHAQFGHIANS